MILTVAVSAAAGAETSSGVRRTSTVRVGSDGKLVRSVTVRPMGAASLNTPPAAAKGVREMAEAIAKRHNVEPVLVDSVVRAESNYNTKAVSHKGALGLMQLMPATARQYGVSDVFDPEQNLEGGVRHLKYLLSLYNGDIKLALAAYNAGEGAVARHKGIPPYSETRNYVEKIGRRVDEARPAATQSPAESAAPRTPVLVKTVDAQGREHYTYR